ncbi:MAG: hypothetical protein U1E45_10715 [Geminicoccaceae bacterium]
MLRDALAALDAIVDEPAVDLEQIAADWYCRRVQLLTEAGRSSSEGDDLEAAALVGLVLSRERVRDLRRRFAPEAWTRPGRRPLKAPDRRI